MVGLQVRQGLVDGEVEAGGDEGVLQTGTLRGVVMDVVGGHHGHVVVPGDSRQLPVAVRVPLEEILLEFHIHGVGTEPIHIISQELVGIVDAVFRGEPGKGSVASSRQ